MTLETPDAAPAAIIADPGRPCLLGSELATALAASWIPGVPQTLLRLLAVADNEPAGGGELAALIRREPALCSGVLAAANSPAMRRGRKLRRVEDCLTVLGTRFVRAMAASLALQAAFAEVTRRLECDLSAFWRHAMDVAELAREIALATHHAQPEAAYLAGLLHDSGQLLLLTAVPDYAAVLIAAGNEPVLCDLEQCVLGTHHGAVGAWLVGQWRLDATLAETILLHHESAPRIAESDGLTRVLWAAHTATVADDCLPAEAAAMVGIDADSLASLRADSRQRTSGIVAALGIASGTVAGTLPLPTGAAAPAPTFASPLAEVARAMGLAQPLQESLFAVSSDEEMLLTVQESARILFGLGRMALLLVDHEQQTLGGARIGGQSALLQGLELSLADSPGLAARAAATGQVLSSFDRDGEAVHLGDLQLLRAVGGVGLLCVPLTVRQKCRGVLVFGVGQAQWPRVSRRLKRLASFARVVAASIDAAQEAHEREQASTAAVSSRFRLQARQIAHEAGNPLAIIRNYLKLLERKLDKEESVARELAFIDEEISRVAQIIQELGDPVTDADDPPRCDPGALLRELLEGYRAPLFANRGIEVTLDLPVVTPLAAVRREPLLQILLNLWKNASEAMPDGGSYRIEVRAPAAPSGHGLIEIRLRDSGPGLAPELWARLSGGGATSQVRGSHGLGLGIVVELVASLGGRIDCASEPGHGTLFCIHLPAAER